MLLNSRVISAIFVNQFLTAIDSKLLRFKTSRPQLAEYSIWRIRLADVQSFLECVPSTPKSGSIHFAKFYYIRACGELTRSLPRFTELFVLE